MSAHATVHVSFLSFFRSVFHRTNHSTVDIEKIMESERFVCDSPLCNCISMEIKDCIVDSLIGYLPPATKLRISGKKPSQIHYLVKWANLSSAHNCYIPQDLLLQCQKARSAIDTFTSTYVRTPVVNRENCCFEIQGANILIAAEDRDNWFCITEPELIIEDKTE